MANKKSLEKKKKAFDKLWGSDSSSSNVSSQPARTFNELWYGYDDSLQSSEVNDAYIQSFLDDYARLQQNTKSKYDSMSYDNYMKAISQSNSERKALAEREKKIRSYIVNNKRSISEDAYRQLMQSLDSFNDYSNAIKDTDKNFEKYFSQYKTKKDYDNAVKREPYKGMSFNSLQMQIRSLEAKGGNRDDIDWLKQYALTYMPKDGDDYKATSEYINKNISSLEEEVKKMRSQVTDVYADNSQDKGMSDRLAKLEDDLGYWRDAKKAMENNKRLVDRENKIIKFEKNAQDREDYEEVSAKRNAVPTYEEYLNNGLKTPKDKLGVFMSLTPDEREEQSGGKAGVGALDPYSGIVAEGIENNWDQMDEKEIKTYYYYLNSGHTNKAYDYLESLKNKLGKKADEKERARIQGLGGGALTLENIASVPASLIVSLPATISDAINIAEGKDINPYGASHAAHNWHGYVRQEAGERMSEDIQNETLKDLVNNGYQAAMSMADSAFGIAVTGGFSRSKEAKAATNIYTASMGLGAATEKAKEMYEQGASNQEIAIGSAIAGATEWATEKWSLDMITGKILASDSFASLKKGLRLAIAGGLSSFVEGSEELASNLTNLAADAIIRGVNSTTEREVRKYMADNNVTEAEARTAIAKQKASEAWWDFYGGAVSGGLFGLGGAVIQTAKNISAERSNRIDTGKSVVENNSAEYIVDQINKLEDTKENKALKKLAEKVTKKTTKGKTDTNSFYSTVGKAYNGLIEAVNDSTAKDIKNSVEGKIEAKLTENNVENPKEAAKIIVKKMSGASLTTTEAKIYDSVSGDKVSSDVMSNPQTLEDITSDVIAPATKKQNMLSSLVDDNKHSNVSSNGQAYITSTNESVNIDSIASIEDGKMTLKLDNGKTVDSADITYAANEQAVLFENLKDADMPIAVKNQLIAEYEPNSRISAAMYVNGVEEGYRYGQINLPKSAIPTNTFFSELTPAQQNNAYRLGQTFAAESTEKAQKSVDNKVNAARKTNNKVKAEKGKVHISDEVRSTLDKKQSKSVEALGFLTSNITNNDVYIYETTKDPNGNIVFAQKVGKFNKGDPAPNGWYDSKTGDIYIDVNAGENAQGLIMWTAAHECTHFIKDWSPSKYKAMADFLVENYAKQGVDVDSLVQDQIDKAKKNGIELSYEEAFDEMVADSMQQMFTDTDAISKLVQLKQEDKTLFQKIKSLIEKLLADIKNLYSEYEPETAEGKYVREMGDAVEQLSNMFADALADAGENYKAARNIGIEIDSKTESANPLTMSERTWNKSDYVQNRDAAAKELASALDVSVNEAKRYIDNINSIAKMIANDRTRLDYLASEGMSSFVSNTEYGGSIDFSTICKKRRLLTGTFTAIQNALPNTALTAEEVLSIRKLMKDKGYEVSCGLCYVEGSRAKMGEYSKAFIEEYKQSNPKYIPTIAEINTPEGIENVRLEHPDTYDAYVKYFNKLAQRKPKLYQLSTEYKGEILDKFKGDKMVDQKNKNGGLRIQSFSDFEIIHLIDMMQVITDMSRVGLYGQAYTKVPEFAAALGNTGLKINLSLIAQGVDKNGKIILDETEGMKKADATKLRNQYSDNVGTIIVVFNDEQLQAAMNDDFIDFIIPFHRSQWNKTQYELMGLPQNAKDYTMSQNESYLFPVFNKNGSKIRPNNYMPNKYWDFTISGKENAEIYLKMCAMDNIKPKFSFLLKDNKDGSYSLKNDGSTDGYWKLLIDFKMYNNQGIGVPQKAVQPNFNMEAAQKMLDDYKGGHQKFPVANDVVEEFVKDYKNNHKGQKFSTRNITEQDSEYLELAKDPKKNEAKLNELIEEAARQNGYNSPVLYHRTNADFTVFDTSKSGSNQGKTKGDGIYLSKYKDEYSYAGNKVMKLYANISNPFEMELTEDEANKIYDKYFKPYHVDTYNTYRPHVINSLMSPVKVFDYLLEAAEKNNTKTSNILSELGYDGVHSGIEWVAFNPNQVKSADPVTYDNNGDVIPLSERFKVDNDDIRYSVRNNGYYGFSLRSENPTDNRTILSNALMEAAQNDTEKEYLQNYQKKIDKLNADQQKLSELRSQIKEISFTKGSDRSQLSKLTNNAKTIADRIARTDRELLKIEAATPLKELLAREKATATKREAERRREMMRKYREGKAGTETRTKIKNLHKKLNTMLFHPTDNSYIPSGLVGAALDVLDAVDIRNGKDNKTQRALTDLYMQYESLKNDQDTDYQSEYDPELAKDIQAIAEILKGGNIYDDGISLPMLQDIYSHINAIYGAIKDAKKLIGDTEHATIQEVGNSIIDEQEEITAKNRKKGVKGVLNTVDDKASLYYLNSLRAVYKMSDFNENSRLFKLFVDLNEGQKKGFDWQMEMSKRLDALVETKEGQKNYDRAIHEIVDFGFGKMTRMQALQLMLTIEREREIGTNHIAVGGAVITNSSKYHENVEKARAKANTTTIKQNPDMMHKALVEYFADDAWIQEYLDVAKDILQRESADRINETSMILKHRKLANGKAYIPFASADSFKITDISGLVNDATIAGRGNLKEVQKGATNPLYIEGLDIALNRTIRFVTEYYGMAIPIRNINKSLNVYNSESGRSVRASIIDNWSESGLKRIEQTLSDIQSPRKNDHIPIIDTLRSAFITKTLNGNISVAIKQAASLDTAFAVLDYRPAAIAWAEFVKTVKNYNSIINEIDEHTSEHWRRRIGLSTDEVAALTQNTGFFGKLNRKLPAAINGNKWIQMIDCWTTASFWNMAKQDINKRLDSLGIDKSTEEGEKKYWDEVVKLYEQTIEETQPMYDTLHRSEFQKNNVLNKIFMFKTQPLQNAGILYTATREYAKAKSTGTDVQKKEATRKLVKALSSQTRSAVTFALMSMISYAIKGKMKRYKDEDGELTFISILKRLGIDMSGTASGLLIPLGGQELFQFVDNSIEGTSFGNELLSMPLVSAVNDYANMITNVFNNPTFDNLVRLITSTADITGQPVTNAYNLVRGAYYNIKDMVNGDFLQFKAGDNLSTIEQYVDAIGEGDSKAAKELYDKLVAEKKENTAKSREKEGRIELTEAESDKRAKQSARTSISSHYKSQYIEAYKNNDAERMAEIRQYLYKTGLFGSASDVVKKCKEWLKDYK